MAQIAGATWDPGARKPKLGWYLPFAYRRRQSRKVVKESFGFNAEGTAQLDQIYDRHISFAPFYATDVIAMKTGQFRELFLG